MRKTMHWYKLLGILILIYIFVKIDLTEVFSTIYRINLFAFLAGLLFMIGFVLMKAVRWICVLDSLSIKIKKLPILINYIYTYGLGLFTPMRTGELLKIDFIFKHSGSLRRSIAALILDRIFDLFFIFLIGSFSFYIFDKIFLSFLLLFLMGAFFLFFIKSEMIYNKFINCFVPAKYKGGFYVKREDVWLLLKKMNNLKFIMATFFSWLAFYLSWFILANSLSIHISFGNIVLITSAVAAASLVPITVSGIGTRDTTLILFFEKIGLSSTHAISLSMVVLTQYFIIFLLTLSVPVITYFYSAMKEKEI